ncbi:MAG: MMPL family transporter, partial [bacterium]|nr:MMPL family transporter [bacterium]
KEIAGVFAALVDDPRFFTPPVYKIDELAESYYQSLSNQRLIALLTADDWAELERLMSARISAGRLQMLRAYRLSMIHPPAPPFDPSLDPLGALDTIRRRLATSRGPTRLDTHDNYFLSADGQSIVILLYPLLRSENGRQAMSTIHFLERSRNYLLDHHPAWQKAITIDFVGSHASTAAQMRRMGNDFGLIIKVASLLAVLLIILVFRKLEAAVFILLPPALGAFWTLGLTYALFGGLSAVTAAFLVVIVSMSLQYSIHLYHRFTLELYRNHNYYRALHRSYVETGRGVLASAVVAALLFSFLVVISLRGVQGGGGILVMLRDSRGFSRLGLIAAVGILFNLAACLVSLPLLAAVKHLLARGRVKPVRLYRFHIERIYEPANARPRATLAVMLLVCVFFGYQAGMLDFTPRFASVSPFFYRTEAGGRTNAQGAGDPPDVGAGVPRPGRPIIAVVEGQSLQDALEQNDRLYENLRTAAVRDNILSVDSLRTVLPSLRSQKASMARLEKLDLEPFRTAIARASRQAGFKPTIYEPFLQALESLKKKAARPEYLNYTTAESDTFIATVQRYITRKENGRYYVATAVYPPAGGFEPWRIGALEADLRPGLGALTLVGDPVVERDLSRLAKFNLAVMILLSTATILAALVIHFRGWRLAWLTFLPVMAEIIWFCGAMVLAGLRIHFFTLMAMPLVLSLAMDNALQLTQYYHDRRPCSVRQCLVAVGRVVVLTCAMAAVLFGAFSLASFAGLRDFGAAVLIGAFMVAVGTLMFLPALLKLFGRDQPLANVLALEDDRT